ncbi:MAG: nucleotidyltransferase domain-containing protein [Candidatus Woesearchaeota archaeon]
MQHFIDNAIEYINEHLGEGVFAIYLKGSYLMKEMLPKSDIDLVVIFKESLRPTFNKIKGHEVLGPVSISGYSLDELKSGKKIGDSQSPKTFMNLVKHYKLLQGTSVLHKNFPSKSFEDTYKDHKKFLKEVFLPAFIEGKHSKQELYKQVLWLSYNELVVDHKNPPYSYKEINDLLPEGHIGKRAYNLRFLDDDKDFLDDLISYLS